MTEVTPIEIMLPQHRFLEPIHNVKEGRERPGYRPKPNWCLHLWRNVPALYAVAAEDLVEPIGIEPMT